MKRLLRDILSEYSDKKLSKLYNDINKTIAGYEINLPCELDIPINREGVYSTYKLFGCLNVIKRTMIQRFIYQSKTK